MTEERWCRHSTLGGGGGVLGGERAEPQEGRF